MRQLNNIPNLFNDEAPNFTLNDIELHVPPTAISVHKEGLEYSWKTLRSKVSTKVASGNGTYHVQVSITFAPDSLVLLHRLIAQVRNNPFIMVKNNFITASLSETHAIKTQPNYFTLFGMNIANHPSSPGAFLVELDLRYFNYKPFGRSLLFKNDYVTKVETSRDIREYVHSVFPNYGSNKSELKPILRRTQNIPWVKSSVRRIQIKNGFWFLKDVSNPSNRISGGLINEATKSNAYKRYANFLQLKYLYENFGISIIKKDAIRESEDIHNVIKISDKLYKLFQGIEINSDTPIRVVGLHEMKDGEGNIDEELVNFRRDLIHAMLVSGMNTKIVVKEFKSLNLGGNFMFRYRKTLRRGIGKGKNEQEQDKKIQENRKKIFEMFSSYEAHEAHKAKTTSELQREAGGEVVLELDSNRNLNFAVPLFPNKNFYSQYAAVDQKYSAPGKKVTINNGNAERYIIRNVAAWDPLDSTNLAFPVLTIAKGYIEHVGSDTVKITTAISRGETVIYTGLQINDDIKDWIRQQGEVEFPAGTMIGFFTQSNKFDLQISSQLMNEIGISLTGKAIDVDYDVTKSKKYKEKVGTHKLDPDGKSFLTKKDAPFINNIKRLIDVEGFSQYIYRSGLENVFQKALILSFDSNFQERDIENITGKSVGDLNADSIPKFEQEITNASCSLRNIISSIPILGYAYPTHQFLGSVEPVYQFNFIGHTGTDGLPHKIKELENIRAHTAYMAKNFPQIPDAANIIVECLLTKLVGSFKYSNSDEKVIEHKDGTAVLREVKPNFLISSTDTFTIEGSPGAVGLNFRFSESKSYDEEEMGLIKTSEVDENYLGRYASVIQNQGVPIGNYSGMQGVKRSYSTAKYVPKFWNTIHFKSASYYALSKRHIRKTYQDHLIGDIDTNAFDFCKDYLDPIQGFLDIYTSKYRKIKGGKIALFSTLDKQGGGRSTKSNHFTGAGVDFRIEHMHVVEAAAILELLEEHRFFHDSIGIRKGVKNRKRILGIGVYGSVAYSSTENLTKDILIDSALHDNWFDPDKNEAFVMRKQDKHWVRSNGFIHLDANMKVTDEGIRTGVYPVNTTRRRWGGKDGLDKFDNYRNFWSDKIESVKKKILPFFRNALDEYLRKKEADDQAAGEASTDGLIVNGVGHQINTRGLFKFENFKSNRDIDIENDTSRLPNQVGPERELVNIKYIVLHHGGHNTEMLKQVWAGTTTSSNIGVALEKDGTIRISQMVDLANRTHHAQGHNGNSIGIDFALSPVVTNSKRYGLRVIDNPVGAGPKKIVELPDSIINAMAQLIAEIHRIMEWGTPVVIPKEDHETREYTTQQIINNGWTVVSHGNVAGAHQPGRWDPQYALGRLDTALGNLTLLEVEAADSEQNEEEEGEVANQTAGTVPDSRETASEENYKFASSKPEDLIKFLEDNQGAMGLSEIDIRKALTYEVRMGAKYRRSVTKYNFEIDSNAGKYELKFLPPRGTAALTDGQKKIIEAIQKYYARELSVQTKTSSEHDTKVTTSVKGNKSAGYGFTEVKTSQGDFKSKSIHFIESELQAKTAQRDALGKARKTNNKLLKSFTELASVMLTEPYLYTDTKEEFIAEMKFIQKELYNFAVLPVYYNSIEKLFTGHSTIDEAQKEITRSRHWGTATGSTIGAGVGGKALYNRHVQKKLGTAVAAKGLAKLGGRLVPYVGWGLLLLDLIYLTEALTTGLDSDSKEQLRRYKLAKKEHNERLNEKGSFLEYIKYYADNKEAILGKKTSISKQGIKKIGNFLDEIGDSDGVSPAINNYVKPIYTELSIFETFNKLALNLETDSRARDLIKTSIRNNSKLVDDEGKIDKNLSNFALADELTMKGIKHYLNFIFKIPAVNVNWSSFDEENAGDIFKTRVENYGHAGGMKGSDFVDYRISFSSNENDTVYWPHTQLPRTTIREWADILTFKDVKKFPYLLNYQVSDISRTEKISGLDKYFEEVVTKEGLKKQNRVKLAYLKSLLKVLLEENMHLNPSIVEKSKDPVLLRVLDGSTVFDLLEANAYPDIDLPQDPENPYNNSNLSPCFYYNDPNDFQEDQLKAIRNNKNMTHAAKKILASSVQFQKGLRAGIFTGAESKLEVDGEQGSIIKELVDSTEIMRSTSDFLLSGPEDSQRAAYVAPTKIGLFDGDTKSANDDWEKAPIEVSTSTESLKSENVIKHLYTSIDNTITDANERIDTVYNDSSREFQRINSAFGSSLGFKLKSSLIEEIKKSGDDETKRSFGTEMQQDYSENALLGLSEDSSKNIYRLKTIKNAFPTFRLYLIEEDEVYSDRLTAFDDFFYYNSVISFNVHNSRELAASTATIQLQNISGILDGTKKKVLRDVDLDPNVKEENMRKEGNFIDSIVLRPGVTVQLRAGYESNTNNLDILISGKITDINYAQNNTICNITVQSFGNELTALRKGNGNKDNNQASVFYSTHQLLGSMMMSDELKHFGRSKVGAVFQTGEYKDYSLDLDLYKKESSFNFSLSRNFFDWVRDNTFGIGIGVGLLTLGGPALRMGMNLKYIKSIRSWYTTAARAPGASRAFTWSYAAGKFTHAVVSKPVSWLNPFGISGTAKKLIIKRAQFLQSNLYSMAARTPTTVTRTKVISTLDDALEFLFQANQTGAIQSLPALSGGMASLLSATPFRSSVAAHGYLQGSVVHVFKKMANLLPFGSVKPGSELGEAFLKQMILKQKGFTALGLNGLAPSALSKGWLATRMGADVAIRSYASVRLPLMIGGGGLAIAGLLAGIDVAVDSLKYLYYSIVGSFSEDKNKLKKKKYLSPQDDNIFAPHPAQYMKNIPKKNPSYGTSFLNASSEHLEDIWMTSKDIINKASWGVINITNSDKLKKLKLNPFKLMDKRLDVKTFENPFVVSGQTIWEILHECTLRHPGYIYGVRPYGNSLEYRVFFGVPSQRYWGKKISNNEIRKLNKIHSELRLLNLDKKKSLTIDTIKQIFPKEYALYKDSYNDTETESLKKHFTIRAFDYYLKKTKERFMPFRQFHLVSSKRNLMSNNIIISSHNMINAVSVNFINNMKDQKDKAKKKGSKDGLAETDGSWSPHLSKYGDRIETLRFRANRNIGMGSLKEKTVSSRNIIGPSNALRYGLGELLYGTRKMYEGSLTILGDTKINPWDVIILHDDITNMYGPVEVCSVTHMLSFETGFITDVEVNALVTSNEELTHPMISQSLVYETRAKIFDEYNNLNALGSDSQQRENTVRGIVEEEVTKLINDTLKEGAGGIRRNIGVGFSTDAGGVSPEKREKLIKHITQRTLDSYKRSGNDFRAGFINDIVPADATIPAELTEILSDAGAGSALFSGTYLVGEAIRRLSTGGGLSLYGGGPWKMGIFFASSLLLSQSGDTINRVLSNSYNSGSLGKNIFRQHILSRMENGNLIQLYPLVKDGLPLVTGGFEEVDETEKWNNMLGYIYHGSSSAIKGYLKRQQELKSYGDRVLEAYDASELDSLKSTVVINFSKAISPFVGKKPASRLLGYVFMDED